MVGEVLAGNLGLGAFVESGGGAVDIVYDKLYVAGTRVHVVMVEVVVGAHGRRGTDWRSEGGD